MRLNKLVNLPEDTPLHTSGFVEDVSAAMGAASTESFYTRQQREKSRQIVAGYNRSIIGQPVMARKYQKPVSRDSKTVPVPESRTTPKERPQGLGGRSFDPYG